jgi:hypothetical protein
MNAFYPSLKVQFVQGRAGLVKRQVLKVGAPTAYAIPSRRLDELLGYYREVGRQLIAHMLSKKANRQRDAGIPLDWKRGIYRFILDCVDVVHVELGHGTSRWELMDVCICLDVAYNQNSNLSADKTKLPKFNLDSIWYW